VTSSAVLKTIPGFCAFAALLAMLACGPARSQTPTGEIKGTVTDSNKPLAGAVVSLANVYAGKSFKVRTDDFGKFVIQNAPYGYYDLEVVSADGDRLLKQQISISPGESPQTATVNIDVSQSKVSSALPNDPEAYGGIRTLPEPNIKNKSKQAKEIKKQNEKIAETNTLILQANAAVLAQKWEEALIPLQELTGMEPDNWEYLGELGDVQYHLGQYQEAIGSYESALLGAGDVSGIDAKTADPESARKKTLVSRMLNNEGNSYNHLRKTREAMAAYARSAELALNPSLAYFNLCVTQYNLKNVEGTIAACDKAISVDPDKAEAYYFKGALLVYANQPALTGKVTAPPAGTAEALKKYLELAPDGEHAKEVREMLNYLSALAKAAGGTKKN
jgi:tetratricopeptide (TPR) repeat protein